MFLVVCLAVTLIPVQTFASGKVSEEAYDENQDPGKERYTGNIPDEFYQMDEENVRMPRAITHSNRFDGYTIEKGIDVSKWQADINWKKVAADGVKFAIIRVAYRTLADGDLLEDPYYKKNIEGAGLRQSPEHRTRRGGGAGSQASSASHALYHSRTRGQARAFQGRNGAEGAGERRMAGRAGRRCEARSRD